MSRLGPRVISADDTVVPAALPSTPLDSADVVQAGTNVVNAWTYGATGDGVTDDTAAIQAAMDAVDGTTGGTVFFPAGSYLVTDMLTRAADNLILQGAGYRNSKLMLSGAGAGITFSKGGANIIYACGMRDITLYGDTTNTIGLTTHNLSEARFDDIAIIRCITGWSNTGTGSGIWTINRPTISYCDTGFASPGTLAQVDIIGANIYQVQTGFDFGTGELYGLTLYAPWFEDFATAFKGVHSATVNVTVRNLNCLDGYFLQSGIYAAAANRLLLSSGDSDVTTATWRGVHFARNYIYMPLSTYLCEVDWGASVNILNRMDLSLRENYLGNGDALTAWFTTDYAQPAIQQLQWSGNTEEATGGYQIAQPVPITDTPDNVHIVREGTHIFPTANLPAANANLDGLVVIEDNGTGDRNLIVYAGGQRFRIDGGANV